jgi:coniferyl-aldehyde dehydrogenase
MKEALRLRVVGPEEASAARIDNLDRIFAAQRAAFRGDPMPSAEARIRHLDRLKQALIKNQKRIVAAIDADFGGRAEGETLLAEILPSVEGIRYAAQRVKKWMKPSRRGVGLMFLPGKARVLYQPLGVVGVITPWNYPLYLAVGPLTGALAAGNRVMIKMSRNTPETGRVLQALIRETFAEDHVAVITGEDGLGSAFAAKPWDHLVFTGSTAVGRHVMRAAADHLTPVTLELGGKSPAIIGPQTPIADAAERIAFGKVVNMGQTCVAPDYVLCPQSRVDEFVAHFEDSLSAMYPAMAENPQYTAIINPREYDRLHGLLADAAAKGARVVPVNPRREDFSQGRKMPVHLLLEVTDDMRVMREEIFGPLLPVIPYATLDEAVAYVNARPRPLALYLFDYDKRNVDHVLAHTHSGGALVNDTLLHVAIDDLPFGGIGESGMGQYHGREGFLALSKAKGVLHKPRFNATRLIYPPYGRWVHRLIFRLLLH